MPKALSTQAIEQFHRDGYHLPIPAISKQEAGEMRRQLEAYEASTGGPLHGAPRYKGHLLLNGCLTSSVPLIFWMQSKT